MESYEIIWKNTLPELEKTVSSIFYETYVKTLKAVDIIGTKLILIAESKLLADIVNNKIAENVIDALKKSNAEVTDFVVYVAKDKDEYLKQIDENEHEKVETQSSPINPRLTFESFVVGSSNEYIFTAAKAVAENPGDAYNPLFIYGGTGLGKTHLLMAIANYLKVKNPSLSVLYATCEQFTNQFIESLAKGKGNDVDFRKRYRNIDVLLIDDVQFLAKKQGIQTEFFHTFNELILQNKQIVLTSDRHPKEIDVLEERLRTRFEGGLIADVQPPDFETRVAIYQKKAAERKSLIDIKVLSYLAETPDDNVRTMEGKLTKVIFASKLHECPITIDLVKEALKESAGEIQEELKMDDIISCVANFYKVGKNDLLGKKKNKEFVEPRQICMYLIWDMMSLPLDTIGKKMGKDHSTVIYSRDKITEELKNNNKLLTEVSDIKNMLLKK